MTDKQPSSPQHEVNDLRQVPGSGRPPAPDARTAGDIDPGERIELTLVLRRRAALPEELVTGRRTITRAELAESYGADPADVDTVRRVLTGRGLEVVDADAGGRRVTVAGTAADVTTAFGTRLARAISTDPVSGAEVSRRHRTGDVQIPAELDGVVVAVLGLDDRPQARARFRIGQMVQTSYTPPQLGTVYRFPGNLDGSGQRIAIIELGGGFEQSDLDTYFSGLGIPAPSVTAVGVDGAVNKPNQDPGGADVEVALDIEVAGALAPGADQVVYFAPNTDQGFLDAVTTAVHADPTPAVISISWGGPEDSWTGQARDALNSAFSDAAALGVSVCAAAGDSGSDDGVSDGQPHVDFPASSPYALGCGGTTLHADPTTGVVSEETVWNSGAAGGATGGGISTVFPLPSWQADAGIPARPGGGAAGRGVPDVAADADPATGYQVLVNGQSEVVGGTSAVAPLWAALTCLLVQGTGRLLGLLQPVLYAQASSGATAQGFRDVTSGQNGAYQAAAGWDACTGLGVPVGDDLLTAVQNATSGSASTEGAQP